MLVKTIKRHRYNGKMHERGEEYDLDGNHVKLLEAVGRIHRIQEIVPAPVKVKKKKKAAKKKGRYRNKNMVSE